MKKFLAAALVLVTFNAAIFAGEVRQHSLNAEKEFTLKFTEAKLNEHWAALNEVRNIIDASDLKLQDAKKVFAAIDALQKDIQSQVTAQVQADAKDASKEKTKKP